MNTEQSPAEKAAQRKENPSGWLYLTRYPSVVFIVDTLLQLPSGFSFDKNELSDYTGLTRRSIEEHIDLLVELGLIEETETTHPQIYRVVGESPMRQAIANLDALISAIADTDHE